MTMIILQVNSLFRLLFRFLDRRQSQPLLSFGLNNVLPLEFSLFLMVQHKLNIENQLFFHFHLSIRWRENWTSRKRYLKGMNVVRHTNS
jgi:hypothetical protein